MSKNSDEILEINNLITSFDTEAGKINAVENVSFSLKKGKTLGLVGESGCGKSVTALSIMRLLPKPAGNIENGKVIYNGKNIIDVAANKNSCARAEAPRRVRINLRHDPEKPKAA